MSKQTVPSSKRTFVTGMGCVTCAGLSPSELWQNAVDEKTGIVDGFGSISTDELTALYQQSTHSPYREVFDQLYQELPLSKPLFLMLAALDQAMREAKWDHLTEEDTILFATTTGQISAWENQLTQFLTNDLTLSQLVPALRLESLGIGLRQLCERIRFHGPTQMITTACSASTQAIALARLWLKQGRAKRCLVGGSEILCRLTQEGFGSFKLLSPQPATPFDKDRIGINLSEGSAFLCLEAEPHQPPKAEITGGGFANDAFHMTAPHPEGIGCYEAMRMALESAGLAPEDISWIHAHGTGSLHNDLAESIAIKNLFKDQCPWVSSTKAIHGHALAASGAIETVLCIESLQKQLILKTIGLVNPDPEISINHPKENLNTPIRHILKNTLGFGGTNGALVISQAEGS